MTANSTLRAPQEMMNEIASEQVVIMQKNKRGGSYRLALDISYYRAQYPDLAHLDDQALEQHWHNFGYQEGRYASVSHENGDPELVSETAGKENVLDGPSSTLNHVDIDFYLSVYADLRPHGITTQSLADVHYERYGKAEGRMPSLSSWMQKNDLPTNLVHSKFSLTAIMERSAARGVEIEAQRILDTLLGVNVSPIELGDTTERTQALFIKLGKHYLSLQRIQQGRHLLEAALSFGSSAEALEHLGNTYLNEGHVSVALSYYEAASTLPTPPKWIALNRASCLARTNRFDEALQVLAEGIASNPNFHQQYEELDRLAEQRWNSFHAELLSWVDSRDRDRLIKEAQKFASQLYEAYLPLYGMFKNSESVGGAEDQNTFGLSELPRLSGLNTSRILIVGDFHIAQCVRYRIDQKVEQLTGQGKDVKAIDWTQLEQFSNELALHDVVIFYRVPAVPKVIKAIAQVNAVGKLSIYEIDDLLFVKEYPPAIETYGGYVSLETYRELTRGMALFGAAASLCRIGLASTKPLCEALGKLVREKKCWLHRNGLDHLNKFRIVDKSEKQTVDIFYGSGTQAHNSDFIEQALPAIERVLNEFPLARLVVVGYLRLPKAFVEKYASQYAQLPAVKNLQGYWSLLEQADINIAVLHDDLINACKSELKWFEAACFGIPSVLSSTANYRDVVRNGQDAFLATTANEWYEAIKKLVANPNLRQEIGMAAMQRAKDDYDTNILGKKLSDQLEEYKLANLNAKPKVALVNVFFPPQSIGGATRVVADNFTVLRKNYAEQLDLCVFTADVECKTPHQVMVYDHQGVRVYRATTLWRENMDWHPKDPEMYRLFKEFLELERPDVIHFHCVQRLTASIVEAARDFGIPYIITAHDAWWISDFQFLVDHNSKVYPIGHPDPYQTIELPSTITLGDSIERRRDLKELLLDADRVLTVSSAFAEIYKQNGVSKIDTVVNGISDEIAWAVKNTSDNARVVCGHIGGMSEHKGYYLLKEAVLEIQPENIELLIVDHSKEEGYELSTNWGRVPVTFVGRTRQEHIVELYGKLDVLFAPSTWPESFGLVTREAVACGCWVIASNLGGIGEDIIEGQNGHVIDPTQKCIENILRKIDESTNTYKGISGTEIKRTASAQVAELEGIYLTLVGDNESKGQIQ
ncbi:glycosyltransferase [Pseudomonas alabamensis]|uniref:glycosyltransferase n=1 Tax=Pseudomonas alabamensis TaxID=3064349 RepID=UPI003F653479